LLPKSLRKKIAINLRKKSTHYQREIKVDITTKGLSKYVKNKNVLIHGHTHIIGTHLHGQLYRLVLSDWHTQGSFISIKDKQISLYSFFPIEKIGSSYSL
jgi:UDP-2,3-diacylglucosamine pyrophosphatase LpxH